jgi:hypothetical protein
VGYDADADRDGGSGVPAASDQLTAS